MAWWPIIINKSLREVPKDGFINTHPSLLPHNRGKHYNFWALVEQAPFGVSLHYVDEGIDSGDIIAQLPIYYDWEDTGATLYYKASYAMVELFKKIYPSLRLKTNSRVKQDLTVGSFHRSDELEEASLIDLDKCYKARELFNILRARTFPGHPGCWFKEAFEEYEVRIEIKRKIINE